MVVVSLTGAAGPNIWSARSVLTNRACVERWGNRRAATDQCSDVNARTWFAAAVGLRTSPILSVGFSLESNMLLSASLSQGATGMNG